jgi:hypothetical protein
VVTGVSPAGNVTVEAAWAGEAAAASATTTDAEPRRRGRRDIQQSFRGAVH